MAGRLRPEGGSVTTARARTLVRALLFLGAIVALALPAAAGAAERRRDVLVGSFDFNSLSELNAFYPAKTTLHVGDTVLFKLNGFHTATFVPPGASLPSFIEQTADPYPAANDFAGDPWWWG